MKNILKEFIATSLVLGTFASAIPTFAIKPAFSEPKSAITETVPDLASCVREFESIAPGVFFVEPDFVQSDPMIAHKILNQITKIFKTYPNITKKFIERTKQTVEKRFTVKLFSDEALKISSLGMPQIDSLKNYASGFFDERPERIDLFINTDENELLAQQSVLESLQLSQTSDIPVLIALSAKNFTTGIISHEMGHLIFSLINFLVNREQYLAYVATGIQIKQRICRMVDSHVSHHEILESISKTPVQEYTIDVNSTWCEIGEQIIGLANSKYGYTGSGSISEYGNHYITEWLAEVFAYAVCNKNPSPLGVAMLEYLENFEKALAK